jgi:hypothetical protein
VEKERGELENQFQKLDLDVVEVVSQVAHESLKMNLSSPYPQKPQYLAAARFGLALA